MNALRLFFCGLLLGLTACLPAASSPPLDAGLPIHSLAISTPPRLPAGALLTIVVQATPATATGSILLTAQGTFGLLPQQQPLVDGQATFQLPPVHTQFAGTVHLRASAALVATTATVDIVPGPAVDPVLPLVGPRSIVADGKHWTMAVTTPRDALDNPVAENTLLTLRIQHPISPTQQAADGLQLMETRTRHLLSWARIYSRTRAGQMLLAATADYGHSPERSVLVVPGLPTPFHLTADRFSIPADGRQLVHLTSEQIVDRFGNVLLDGTSVTVLATMPPHDQRSLPTMTIDGRLYLALQAPNQPGRMTVQAWIAGVASQPLQLDFTPGPAVQQILVTTQKTANGLVVQAGPLVGQLGQFIPNGAAVTFTLTAPDGTVETFSAAADYGYAQIMLRQSSLLAGRYQVAVTAGTGQGTLAFDVPAAAE